MIVDDGPEVRQVIRAIFEARTDYEICGEASNGAEAIERALALKPDLLLLDVAMPLLNGVEVASVLGGSMLRCHRALHHVQRVARVIAGCRRRS